MQTDRRWQTALLVRVLANVVAGALLLALAGTLCGLTTGALASWVSNVAAAAAGVPTAFLDGSIFIASCGATGAVAGALVGGFIFAIAAVRARPGRTFEPLRALIGRVVLGSIAGTAGFCSLFLAVEGARAAQSRVSLAAVAMGDLTSLFAGALIMMVCGAIAGAFSVRGHQPRPGEPK